eukprot:scaffold6863_cov103-Skeletonema_dohrnii-CCMP3373.AAC.1
MLLSRAVCCMCVVSGNTYVLITFARACVVVVMWCLTPKGKKGEGAENVNDPRRRSQYRSLNQYDDTSPKRHYLQQSTTN